MWNGWQFTASIVGQLVQLVGHVAWPGSVVLIVWILREPIERLIDRVRSAEWGDRKISFAEGIERVVEEATASGVSELPPITASVDAQLENTEAGDVARERARSQILFDLSESHPALSVVEAWKGVEAAARAVVARRVDESSSRQSMFRVTTSLERAGVESSLLRLIRDMQRLRNVAAHEIDSNINSSDARQFVDLAESVRARLETEARN